MLRGKDPRPKTRPRPFFKHCLQQQKMKLSEACVVVLLVLLLTLLLTLNVTMAVALHYLAQYSRNMQ